ncbi:hypothetical protein DQ353_14115 [Arthrobacter sp. AQ5-05]|uniref:FAD:protein FMN transferase n=1 Tax=Arthrobacter sp. AQ5-05 TaxID=2184581 RepID=UPI000DCC993E|nr:FAD:protein FMN transferase [Arthrobacter sp. AQ5-05]RAX48665.1 hypothetical protein DQ353_14115 [Arthrobacter sp. AQ5-05]
MGVTASWPVWGLEASIAVEDPGVASDAERLVRGVVAQIDDACSRFRPDSELMRLQPELDSGAEASPLLAALVRSALDAARWTDGDVDPTLGKDMESLGYDRDIARVRLGSSGAVATLSLPQRRTPGWQQVDLEGRKLTVPRNLRLDLGATAKAVAADRAASLVFDEMGCGILVSLGGDIATAGPEPEGRWQVLVQDLPTDPCQQVTLGAGRAMATSSTQKRRWKHDGHDMHHILDPRFGLPAEPVWRSVTVAASTCLLANAYSTAGIVRGFGAVAWFEREGIAGRLVDRQGRIVATGGWPGDEDMLTGVDSRG